MKKFKITEEQIKENQDLTLKQYFKEVFETKLEVGKWYKDETSDLLYFPLDIKNNNSIRAYGFTRKGVYDNDDLTYRWGTTENIRLATEEEVFNALKKEAEKKYKLGQIVKSAIGNNITTIKRFNFNYNLNINNLVSDFNSIDSTSVSLFNNGKWAEIISQPEEVIELNGVKYKRID